MARNENDQEPMDLAKVLAGEHYQYQTDAGIIVRVAIEKVKGLVNVPPDYTPPDDKVLTLWLSQLYTNRLDPFSNECWLIPYKQGGLIKWTPVIAEKVRLQRASSRTDYEGFEQGWITQDGIRHKTGTDCQAKQEAIVGVWGIFYRKGRKPLPLETFCSEYASSQLAKTKKLTHILKVNRDQGHRLSFPEICTSLYTENELLPETGPVDQITPTVPAREERKQAEDVTVTDTQEVMADELPKLLERFNAFAETALEASLEKVPGSVLQVAFVRFAAWILDGTMDATAEVPNYSILDNWTLEKLSQVRAHLEHEGVPDDILALIPLPAEDPVKEAEEHAADVLRDYKYKCVAKNTKGEVCGNMFDEPVKGKLCPKCFSKNIVNLEEVEAEK